jgi:hypothetical protein
MVIHGLLLEMASAKLHSRLPSRLLQEQQPILLDLGEICGLADHVPQFYVYDPSCNRQPHFDLPWRIRP